MVLADQRRFTSVDTEDKMNGYVASLAGLLLSGVAFVGRVLLPDIVTTYSPHISWADGASTLPSYSTLPYL
jgi:hypothetical protein